MSRVPIHRGPEGLPVQSYLAFGCRIDKFGIDRYLTRRALLCYLKTDRKKVDADITYEILERVFDRKGYIGRIDGRYSPEAP